jgi:purine-binding chemotaxis protein CheW
MSQILTDDGLSEEGSKYLTFTIGKVCYGLDIRTVTEIIGLQGITPIPDVPDYVRGVINLRGKVIPVMDVRARFKLETQKYHDRTCIIVIEVDDASVGLVVDAVSEVLSIPDDDIEPLPNVGFGPDNRFISGIGKVGDDVKLILDAAILIDAERQVLENKTMAEAS